MQDLLTHHRPLVIKFLQELEQSLPLSKNKLLALQKKHALPTGRMLSKTELIALYKHLAGTNGLQPFSPAVVRQLRMKPSRTVSGIAPITVLTKPFPCPGNCLFCPSDVRMPKSYLASEPGAQRAERNFFDPYLQVYNRLLALYDMGHPVDKIELIVLGGSWSSYPQPYQLWFITECFRALNEFKKTDDRTRLQQFYQDVLERVSQLNKPFLSSDSKVNEQVFLKHQPQGLATEQNQYNSVVKKLFFETERLLGLDKFQSASWHQLQHQQQLNERATYRCVGLSLETRPDLITPAEVKKLRRFGCTKVQIGLQSLDNQVLKLNQRGHTVEQSALAMSLLRGAGFKIHVHWMPNLLGSSPAQDKQDYLKLFTDDRFRPDEIKIYPCSLIKSAPLMSYYQTGEWRPYSYEELLDVLSFCLLNTPPYCRVTRMIRDIPSFEIVAGNKKSNFRQIVQSKLDLAEKKSVDIRAREIRNSRFEKEQVFYQELKYETDSSQEIFLQYLVQVEKEEKLLGFLRLSLPKQTRFIKDLIGANCAMIREVHVYGQLVGLGKSSEGKAQHLGLGSKLIKKAKKIVEKNGYKKLAVISAVGTREYYRQRGFVDDNLYQFVNLSTS